MRDLRLAGSRGKSIKPGITAAFEPTAAPNPTLIPAPRPELTQVVRAELSDYFNIKERIYLQDRYYGVLQDGSMPSGSEFFEGMIIDG